MMQGLPSLDPTIELLRKELQVNNVPPGQEGQYFQSKGRPLDPRIVYLIQANKQLHQDADNNATPPMSTVFDDASAALVRKANQAMAPKQPMGMMALQRPAQQQVEPGIAALPAGNMERGFAGGGIVAFAKGTTVKSDDDDTSGTSSDDDEDEDDDSEPTGIASTLPPAEAAPVAASQRDIDVGARDNALAAALNPVNAAAKAPAASTASVSPLAALAKQATDPVKMTIEERLENLKKQYAPVQALDKEELARKVAAQEELNRQSKKDKWLALAQAGFGSVGKHTNIMQAIGDIGENAAKGIAPIEAARRAGEEQLKQAQYNLKRADALMEAGFPAQAQALHQAAVKSAVDAQYKLERAGAARAKVTVDQTYREGQLRNEADRIRSSGTAGAQFYRSNVQPLYDRLDKETNPAARAQIESQIEARLNDVKNHPELLATPLAVQQSRGETAVEIQGMKGAQAEQLQLAKSESAKVVADIRAKATVDSKKLGNAIQALNIASTNLRKAYDKTFKAADKAAIKDELDDINKRLQELNGYKNTNKIETPAPAAGQNQRVKVDESGNPIQ